MRTLGYVYNRSAASLRTQRTHTVGVAINELENAYFAALAASIERALNRIGYSVFLSNSAEDPVHQDHFIETMREYNADGLIICPAENTTAQSLNQLMQFQVPCVQISRYVPGAHVDFAGNDHRRGMFLATEHLISLGHTRLAMIGGNERSSTGIERRQGFVAALDAHGVPYDPAMMVVCSHTREGGAQAIRDLLARNNAPTAVVCYNDLIAFGVMLGLRQIGREPGEDFPVVGCDDVSEAALWSPGLTSVAIDTNAMGDAAVQLLLQRMVAPNAPCCEVVLEPKLIVRASSGGLRHTRTKPKTPMSS
jgi:LacI family transcriptional regulator